MLGLTFDKLLILITIAAIVIGPQRLPMYAARLGELARRFRDFTDTARTRAADEFSDIPADRLRRLDPRQYDPRRIIREALDSCPTPTPDQHIAGTDTEAEPAPDDDSAPVAAAKLRAGSDGRYRRLSEL